MKFWQFLVVLFCYSTCTKEQNEPPIETTINATTVFTKTFGGSRNEVARAIVKTNDNGYAILGHTQSNNGDITTKLIEDFDFLLLKFSDKDNLQWSKTFGGLDDDRGLDIIQTQDNGFALLGFSKSENGDVTQNNGLQDFWLIKLTENGEIIWQKTFGFSGNDVGTSVLETNDGGLLITGTLDVTASQGEGNSKTTSKKHAGGDFWALKLDVNGNLEWSRYFGGTFTDAPLDAIETQNNNYIIVGSSDSNDVDISGNLGVYDFWVVNISAEGNLIWEKSFGGSQIDEAWGISNTNDNNFILVGDTRSSDKNVSLNNGAADIWMIKISLEGNLIWEKTIGATGFDVARSIKKTTDDGFIISGSSRSTDNGFTNEGQNDALLIKVDANGNLIWQKTIGGSETDFLYDAIQINENEYIAVGESSSSNGDIQENKGFTDALIIKLNTE